jgi:sugar lactone lactonase YvrE
VIRKPELVVKADAVIGEGPVWDTQNQLLYWVDIPGRMLHVHDPRAGTDRGLSVGHLIGSMALRSSHELVVALDNGFSFFDLDTGALTPIADPEAHIPANRFNDGKCDARGRFWAGTQTPDDSAGSALYRLGRDRTVKKMLDSVSISNGIAWSPDNAVMYYIDSKVMGVAAFDFDLETGDIRNRRYPIEIPAGNGVPDGMTIDDEGMVYVAHWDGYQVSKWDPRSGKCLDTIRLPIAKVTSCAFGGPNLDELYITTARQDVKPGDDAQRDAGSVYRMKMDVSGAECHRYAG